MNARLFLENFGHLANAPGGVKILRELVFYFGMSGGLSSQEPGDSDVTLIQKATLLAKQVYLDENNVRLSQRKNVELRQTVASVPTWWTLIPAGDLVHLINGRAFKSSEWQSTGVPIIRIQNLNNTNASFNYYQGELSDGHKVSTGDMLLSWSGTPGTSFGAFIWDGGDAALNQHIFKVIIYCDLIDKEYLKLAINACLEALIGSARGGVGLKHVTKGQIEALQIPLPPLEEQKRIVAKVDELMALCDKLEAQQQERERLFPVLSRATHTRFAESPTPEYLQVVFNDVGIGITADIRELITNLAVQGCLSKRLDGDEPVESLLDRVEAERARVGLLTLANDSTNNPKLNYVTPENWRWKTLDELIISGPTNGISPKAVKHETSTRSLTLSATTSGYFNGEHSKFIELEVPPDSDLWLSKGDVLVQRGNSMEYVGVSAVYYGEDNQFVYPDLMMRCRFASELDVRFIHLAMNQNDARGFLRARATGTSGSMPKINQKTLKCLPLPIPPIAEQHRIVAKVDQLMALVSQLEEQKIQKVNVATAFARATVAAITGTHNKESAPMRAPKTELITKLETGAKPNATEGAPLATLIAKHKGSVSAKILWKQSGMEIDTFYQQLKTEMASGWIVEPVPAVMKEVEAG